MGRRWEGDEKEKQSTGVDPLKKLKERTEGMKDQRPNARTKETREMEELNTKGTRKKAEKEIGKTGRKEGTGNLD